MLRAGKRGRKGKPSLGEVHRRDDGGVEGRQTKREVDDPMVSVRIEAT